MEHSVFVDESGDTVTSSECYLLALVLHDQRDTIADGIARYESRLRGASLPDVPFHMEPLMGGEGDCC